MVGSNFKIELNVKNLDLFKNLVELLEKHFDDLPVELQESLKSASENGANDFKAEDLEDMYPEIDFKKVTTSIDNENIYSVNKILKKVVYFRDGNFDEPLSVNPETFYLKYDGKTIIEW